jgi:oligosaccharide reducing-end xylanase
MSFHFQKVKRMKCRIILILILFLFFPAGIVFSSGSGELALSSSDRSDSKGAYYTGIYRNLFSDLLGKSEAEVKARITGTFDQLFYGSNDSQRVYFPVEPDMGYIEDILNKDVRTEGMSYGMMITVQLNKKTEFDRLWKWAKTYMQHQSGPRKNFFAWHCTTSGAILDSNAASDGEEWFAMALFLASARWGDGEGIFDYKAGAQAILDAMLHQKENPENDGTITNMFDEKEKQVVFVPSVQAAGFTDPSYHLPHYYELWARWATKDNQFWCDAASASRALLQKAADSTTGLSPDYADFDGTPITPWPGGQDDFRFDAWRVAMNVSMDYVWFAKDPWEVTEANRLLSFFSLQGVGTYGNQYTLKGEKLSSDHSPGLVAMNAVAALISTNINRKEFVKDFWNTPVPSRLYRYYDGLLYMLGMLQVSGNFRVYHLAEGPVPACSGK